VHPSARTDALAASRHRSIIGVRLLGGLIVLSAFPRSAREICTECESNASFTMPPGLQGRGYRLTHARAGSFR
jgi:hypothetical protein